MSFATRPQDYERPSGVNIESWASEALSALTISTAVVADQVSGQSVELDIPLDLEQPVRPQLANKPRPTDVPAGYTRREPLRRDSLKRRELLLKGKEGSRRRQKWENDRLMGNPWAEAPEPRDWEVRPTYPVHAVPYFLAPLWDERQANERKRAHEAVSRNKREKSQKPRDMGQEQAAAIPKTLRQKLKKSKGAKGLLQDLEEQVRNFVVMWEAKERQLERDGLVDADSEDEDIVFVGRNGQMQDTPSRRTSEENLKRDKLIFESLVDDHGASFGRWLVHSIASYYNLRTWSITTGNPARREAYVGIKDPASRERCRGVDGVQLPRPLWGLV